jgi:hypothetical protein
MHLNLPYFEEKNASEFAIFRYGFRRSQKYNRRFLKVFYFSLWSPSFFFPGEISPVFNKEIGKFLENF